MEKVSDIHLPVMLETTVNSWFSNPDGVYIDGTFGRGGHSKKLLESLSSKAELLVIDMDPHAILSAEKLATKYRQVSVKQSNFSSMLDLVKERGWEGKVNGILLDLGVSSPQLDCNSRGFSFLHDGMLDMRMDPNNGCSAAEWIAVASQEEIQKVLRDYGEEKFSKRIASSIIKNRQKKPIKTTKQLAGIIADSIPYCNKKRHPATQSFQAIRIFINKELDNLINFLEQCLDILCVGGRLAIISFHSLEDRIVKRYFRSKVMGQNIPSLIPILDKDIKRQMKLIINGEKASSSELKVNPRARSAVLRVAEKL